MRPYAKRCLHQGDLQQPVAEACAPDRAATPVVLPSARRSANTAPLQPPERDSASRSSIIGRSDQILDVLAGPQRDLVGGEARDQ